MPARKNGRQHAFASKIGLNKFPGFTRKNLMILFREREISRQEMFDGFWFIRKYNNPNPSERELMSLVETELQTKQPSQLPSFELFALWADFQSRLIDYGVRTADEVSEIFYWDNDFDLQAYFSLWPMYGGMNLCTSRCSEFLHSSFEEAMKKNLRLETLGFWRDMLDLWIMILPANEAVKVQAYRKLVNERMAAPMA